MNKDNAKDYLPLVQALADGKQLQYLDGFGNWGDTGGIYAPYFDEDPSCYRIKPEPRTFEVWHNKITGEIENGDVFGYDTYIWEQITVQEVPEARTLKPES